MSSKQLNSILNTIPAATVQKNTPAEISPTINNPEPLIAKKNEEYERVVAVIPKELKDEIREHLRNDKSVTEKTIILKGLKLLGFNVKNEWLVDKRTLR